MAEPSAKPLKVAVVIVPRGPLAGLSEMTRSMVTLALFSAPSGAFSFHVTGFSPPEAAFMTPADCLILMEYLPETGDIWASPLGLTFGTVMVTLLPLTTTLLGLPL